MTALFAARILDAKSFHRGAAIGGSEAVGDFCLARPFRREASKHDQCNDNQQQKRENWESVHGAPHEGKALVTRGACNG